MSVSESTRVGTAAAGPAAAADHADPAAAADHDHNGLGNQGIFGGRENCSTLGQMAYMMKSASLYHAGIVMRSVQRRQALPIAERLTVLHVSQVREFSNSGFFRLLQVMSVFLEGWVRVGA